MNSGLHCELCDVGFPSEYQKKQHFTGKKHTKKLATQNKDWQQRGLYCHLCDVPLASTYQENEHMNGRKHLAKLANLSMDRGGVEYYGQEIHVIKEES